MKSQIMKGLGIVTAAAMLVPMAACGSNSSASSSNKDSLKGTVTFETWNLKNDKYTPFLTQAIKTYEKNHPGSHIKWVDAPSDGYTQKLSTEAAANELPDIIDGGPAVVYPLAKAGALLNLSKEDPSAKNIYTEGAWNAVTFHGRGMQVGAYGYPWYVNDGPMYWNTKLMKQCGISTDKLPETWDEYFAAAKTMTKNCKNVYMSTMIGGATDDYASAGIKIMNADQTKYIFNTPKAVAHLQKFVDLYKAGGIPPEALSATWSQQADYFQRGSIIGMGGSAYSAAGFKQNAPDLYKNLAVGPKISDEGKSASVSYDSLSIAKTCKYPKLAMDFARFITNSKNQLEFDKLSSCFPSTKGTIDDPYFKKAASGSDLQSQAIKITMNAVTKGYSNRPPMMSDADGWNYLQQQAALALQGKQTAKQALDKAVDFANSRLK